MKNFFEKWIVPILVVLAIVGFFLLGKKLSFLGNFAYAKKKQKLDKKIEEVTKKIEENEAKIAIEKEKIEQNDEKIKEINIEREQFEKELDDAKNNHDKLDAMFAELLG